MRARNIKPGFWKNEELAEIPYEARLLFIGLWAMADREGRLEDRPKRIRAEIFPFDSINVEKLLDVITLRDFILRYTINEKPYIQIINFNKHQNPHPHEARSTIPPCNDIKRNVMLNPSSLNPDTMNPDTPRRDMAREFDLVWASYPKRIGKKAAERFYRASVKTPEDAELLGLAMRNYLRSERVKAGYVQNGSTWFNNWRDWIRDPERVERREPVAMPKRVEPEPELSEEDRNASLEFLKTLKETLGKGAKAV